MRIANFFVTTMLLFACNPVSVRSADRADMSTYVATCSDSNSCRERVHKARIEVCGPRGSRVIGTRTLNGEYRLTFRCNWSS